MSENHGELGDFWLERYDAERDAGHLDRAIQEYEAAIAAAADDEGPLWWWYALALAYQARGEHTGDLADYDEAIDIGTRLADALVPGEERDGTLSVLADSHRGRFLTAYYRNESLEPHDAVVEARAAATAIGRIAADVTEPASTTPLRVVHGLALLQVSDLTGDRADLAAGIAELAPAVDQIDPETPHFDEACSELCCAYVQRAIDDEAADDLERAIQVGRRVEDSGDPLVHHALAVAYQGRWDGLAAPDDLDHAIEHWRATLSSVPDPWGRAQCGRLLSERAELRESASDASGAVGLLEEAASAGEPCWWDLGWAHFQRWRLAKDPDDLERAGKCLDRAIGDPPSPEWLVFSYPRRLAVTQEQIDAEAGRDPGRTPPSSRAMLRQIGAARAVFDTGVGDDDGRALLAGILAVSSLRVGQFHPQSVEPAWIVEMVAYARALQDKPEDWDLDLNAVEATARYASDVTAGKPPRQSLDLILASPRAVNKTPKQLADWRNLTSMFLSARGVYGGDRRTLRAAAEQLGASDDAEAGAIGEAFDLLDRGMRGDVGVHDDLRRLLDRLRAEPLPDTGPWSTMDFLAMAEAPFAALDGRYRPVDHSPVVAGDLASAVRAVTALPGPMVAAVTRHDVDTLRECGARVDEVLDVLPAGHLLRLVTAGFAVQSGVALLRDEPGDQEAAGQLLRWTAECLTLAGGPHHPDWHTFALAHGEALRNLAGADRAESRRWGLSGLHGFAWRVLLQSGTDDAVTAATDAGEAARRVAGWCRADAAMEDLVAALDAGRGLVLHAATASRTIADRLADSGHPDLADEWRASAGYGSDAMTGSPLNAAAMPSIEIPDELRTRVLHALDVTAPAPASAADIRAALTSTGADALVYLIPAAVDQPGAAVVVPADAPATTLTLPGLLIGQNSRLARYAGAVRGRAPQPGAARDAGPVAGGETPAEIATDDLCRWAWSAAMAPLLRHLDPDGTGRVVRLVVVPTGPLSGVPWHAAFRTDGGVRQYVVERAVISYAVSGRAFVESARHPTRDIRSVLVVGDPTGDLPFAGGEARAIARAFYPDGTFLGMTEGSGTPQQVLDWIDAAAPGPSLLHLACHGQADPGRPADACLRLADGELTARRLLEASRLAELEMERVFLAACATGVTGADHDEAFSLTTAFLAAGARTVFGSLWEIPDEETSLLMFLVHHYLNASGRSPVDALRQAQLWMLDQDRKPPAEMPPELLQHCDNPALAEPRCWAAFTHQGR